MSSEDTSEVAARPRTRAAAPPTPAGASTPPGSRCSASARCASSRSRSASRSSAAVLGGGGGQPIVRALAFGAVGALIAAAARARRLADDALVGRRGTIRLRTGVLSRKETDIPLGRVQALDIVHGPIQRLFGVRGVHVQTAGGAQQGEITLPAVGADDVELLRAALRRRARRAPRRTSRRRSPSAG